MIESKRWLAGCLLLFCIGCNSNNQPGDAKEEKKAVEEALSKQRELRAFASIHTILDSIRSGDMITRTGNDFTSYCLRQFCQTDKTYSHCGIASIENDTVFVYHALGGEFNPDQKLLREPLKIFAAPAANYGFAVFRFEMSSSRHEKLLTATKEAFQQGIRFDMQFDLASDEKMYCSEFTAKMYRRALGNDTLFAPSRIMNFEFLAPDNLFTHPLCRRLYEARF